MNTALTSWPRRRLWLALSAPWLFGACGADHEPLNLIQPGQLVPLEGGWCDRLERHSRCDDGRCLTASCFDHPRDELNDHRNDPCPVQIQVDLDALYSLQEDLLRERIPWSSCEYEGQVYARLLLYYMNHPTWPPSSGIDHYYNMISTCEGGAAPDPGNRWQIVVTNLTCR